MSDSNSSSRSFCPRCGDTMDPPEEPRPGEPRDPDAVLCDSCYFEDFDLVDAPERIEVGVCAQCGAVHRGKRWVDVGAKDYTDVAVEETTRSLGVHLEAEEVEWMVEPVPELDNEWGDFRYPASEAVIGPEIRRFQYSRDRPGADPTADQWRAVRWSHGPYFWRKSGVKGDVGPVPSSDDPDGWDQYRFSKATGHPDAHPNHTGLIGTTGEDFLVSPDGNGRTCFWTTLRATEGGTVRCHYGPEIERIEIGARTIDPTGAESAAAIRTGTALLCAGDSGSHSRI